MISWFRVCLIFQPCRLLLDLDWQNFQKLQERFIMSVAKTFKHIYTPNIHTAVLSLPQHLYNVPDLCASPWILSLGKMDSDAKAHTLEFYFWLCHFDWEGQEKEGGAEGLHWFLLILLFYFLSLTRIGFFLLSPFLYLHFSLFCPFVPSL